MSTTECIPVSASCGHVASMLRRGATSWEVVVEWLLATRLPVADIMANFGTTLAEDTELLAMVCQEQQRMAVAAATKAATGGGGNITWKVSKRGAVSVYGLNSRMPVTLYAPQWERLAQAILGVNGEYPKTPLGEWLASKPVGTYKASENYTVDADREWLEMAVKEGRAKMTGDTVTVYVSTSKGGVA